MYWFDARSGETVFEFTPAEAAASGPVRLLYGVAEALRAVTMEPCADRWVARLRLPSGLHAYVFEVAGKLRRDGGSGMVRAKDGRWRSLAVVPGSNASKPRRRPGFAGWSTPSLFPA